METSQIDAGKIEAAITEQTKAIIAVHLGGNVADVDKIMAISNQHHIPVIEDACQAHLAEWRGRMVGSWGLGGCFSFQASKNLNCGDGGAVITNDDEFANLCEGFQDQGRPKRPAKTGRGTRGGNLRMTEFQGALLQAQMTRIEAQARCREQNAEYLTSMLKEIPGIIPTRQYEGCTRHAHHLYSFRYKQEHFAGLSRDRFMEALRKEGVHDTAAGYSPWNKEEHVNLLLQDRHFQKLYPRKLSNAGRNSASVLRTIFFVPRTCASPRTMLLGPRSDMDQIVQAIRKLQAHAGRTRPGVNPDSDRDACLFVILSPGARLK